MKERRTYEKVPLGFSWSKEKNFQDKPWAKVYLCLPLPWFRHFSGWDHAAGDNRLRWQFLRLNMSLGVMSSFRAVDLNLHFALGWDERTKK